MWFTVNQNRFTSTWSKTTAISNECGLKWTSLMWMWSQMNVGIKWMWSQMNRSRMNVVSNEKVPCECGLKRTGFNWTWSQMNVLKRMVSNALVSIVREPTAKWWNITPVPSTLLRAYFFHISDFYHYDLISP